jgi:hypothetical protein
MPVFHRRQPEFCLASPKALQDSIRFLADHGELNIKKGLG